MRIFLWSKMFKQLREYKEEPFSEEVLNLSRQDNALFKTTANIGQNLSVTQHLDQERESYSSLILDIPTLKKSIGIMIVHLQPVLSL